MFAPYSSKAVANSILHLSQERGVYDNTPMKIQKLVYYAHAWYLAFYGVPLIKDEIQAWKYGPVIPELYFAFSEYGDSVIQSPTTELYYFDGKLDIIVPSVGTDDAQAFGTIVETIRVYGGFNPIQLSNMSHMDGEPWKFIADRYGSQLPHGLEIPDNLIMECFRKKQNQQGAQYGRV
ncbi:Panacea domain-containing protein [Pseudomonas gingeri]|uniref:Panacea domain-containing protein n=1 Tax=Pseudomonas gingeri TaxID=117681 RepID=UPI0015A0F28E|nr:type II toxin-antitoxin system antitoxin SocA domain-containing protein [Pseudomonas gingeri]NWE46865.1 DUF4065 domain-containing protein [Pseudomonas gingeri]